MLILRCALIAGLTLPLFACETNESAAPEIATDDGGLATALPSNTSPSVTQANQPRDCGLEPAPIGPAFEPFADEQALAAYVAAITATCPRPRGTGGGGLDAGASASGASEFDNGDEASEASESSSADSAGSAAPGNEEITNNQEVGVDEGGIVKNVGDALVVLRKGRLFALDVSASGAPSQTDSVRVAANEALNSDVWYDELLAHGELLYVIGYRYRVPLGATVDGGQGESSHSGATEINVFRLHAGKLTRVGQSFIESWDYYSGSNYASRLVDGQLVFYMPFRAVREYRTDPATGRRSGVPAIPRVFRYDLTSERFEVVGPLFRAGDVHRPLELPNGPVFHSIVRCELADTGSLSCLTKAVLGGYTQQFYVAPKRVYLSTADRVYALGLDASQSGWSLSAHRVEGVPSSQFAFKELDETLHIATTSYGEGSQELVMLSLPLAAFDRSGSQDVSARRALLAKLGQGRSQRVSTERFVGSTYIAGLGGYGNGAIRSRVIYDVARAAPAQVVQGTIAYQRIEALGSARALLVGSMVDPKYQRPVGALELEVWSLSGEPARVGGVSLEGLAEGESRSHGFFYKAAEGLQGTFGLPVLGGDAEGSSHWYGRGASNIAFFDVSPSHAVTTLGAAASSDTESVCETSCTDWYGNTRPIFLGDRAFALMGSELAELTLRPEVSVLGERVHLTF